MSSRKIKSCRYILLILLFFSGISLKPASIQPNEVRAELEKLATHLETSYRYYSQLEYSPDQYTIQRHAALVGFGKHLQSRLSQISDENIEELHRETKGYLTRLLALQSGNHPDNRSDEPPNELCIAELIGRLNELEQAQIAELARERSDIQTRKRIVLRFFAEFAHQCATRLLKYHKKYILEEDPAKKKLIEKNDVNRPLRETITLTLKNFFPTLYNHRKKDIGILMGRIFFNKTIEEIIPNEHATQKQKLAQMLIPLVSATLLVKLIFAHKDKKDPGKNETLGGTLYSLFLDVLSRLFLVRFYMSEDHPYYKYLNIISQVTPFITRETGQRMIKEAREGKNIFTVTNGTDSLFDWLEELLVYDGTNWLVEKTIPKWLKAENDPLYPLQTGKFDAETAG